MPEKKAWGKRLLGKDGCGKVHTECELGGDVGVMCGCWIVLGVLAVCGRGVWVQVKAR